MKKKATKMIRRHPHVFGDVTAEDAEAVVANWEAIKKQEKGESVDEPLLKNESPQISNRFNKLFK